MTDTMNTQDIRRLNTLAIEAAASLAPIATRGHTDSHGGTVEPLAQSVARALDNLIEAGRLAEKIKEASAR